MIDLLKEIINVFRSKERVQGFAIAFWIIFVILTSVTFIGAIEFREPIPGHYWASADPNNYVLGFPSWTNPDYKLYILSIGAHGGSTSIIVEQVNGWKYNGTFYVGDSFTVDGWEVTIKEINLDREKPVLLEYCRLIDLKPLLLVLTALVTIWLIWEARPATHKRK